MASSPRIEELRKKFEENPRRYFAPLANEYRKAGDVQQAIAICREYLPQQPGHMSGHIVFGQALYEARSFDEARTVFETALSLDPENLIALRHLGDIALITGDSDNATTWYKRVLDADPRNEEIQAQLASIAQASSSAPTPAITPAIPQAPPAPAPSSSAPTVVMNAVQPPARTPAAPVTATSPTAEVNLDMIAPVPAAPDAEPTVEVPVMGANAPGAVHASSEPAVAPLEGLEGSAATGTEATISSFSLDGLETTSLSAHAAPATAEPALADLDFGPAGAPPSPAPTAAPEPLPDLDFAAPASATAPEPPLIDVPTVVIEKSTETPELDLDLGSLAATPASPAPPAASAPTPVTATPAVAADETPLDVEIAIPNAPTPVAGTLTPPAVESVAPADPFMTETMAELYVQQGHREEALRVYRTLLEQRPGDATIQGRIADLESELAPGPASAAAPPAAPGPTMREMLLAIATRRPGHRPDWPAINGSRAKSPSVPAADHSRPAEPAPVAETPRAPRDARDDILGASLAFGLPGAADDHAAHVLARAFSQNGHGSGAPLIGGEPARPAGDELSLKSVFGSAEPAPPPASFSFDQFFSQRASAEFPAPIVPQGQAAESAEEVAQFTQWLEGLKKR